LAAPIEIRRAVAENAPAIAGVLHEAFVEFQDLYTERGFAATTPDSGQVLARMEEGPVWIALREGVVIGTAAAVAKGDSIYIRGMAVLPAARGSGCGAALLQHVEAWAAGLRCSRLYLSTTPFLHSAIRLYEASGFLRTSAGPHELFGTPLFTMEKFISR